MTGTVAQWQAWTAMLFPATGEYVIPDGLSTLHIDVENDRPALHRTPGRPHGCWMSAVALAPMPTI
jgi:hypothetical protein